MGSYIIVNETLVPLLDSRLQIADFAKDASEEVPDQENVWFYKTGMDPIAFYMERPVFRAESRQKIEAVIKKNRNTYILARKPHLDDLIPCGQVTVVHKMELKKNSIRPKYHDYVLIKMNKMASIASNDLN